MSAVHGIVLDAHHDATVMAREPAPRCTSYCLEACDGHCLARPDYAAFLAGKVKLATGDGLPCEPHEVHPIAKPHQRDIICWAVRGGRRAIFAAFGLGKSIMQLETVRLVLAKAGGGRGLIVCPLGVRQEFTRDAAMLGLRVAFIRTTDEADTIEAQGDIFGAEAPRIYLTNYESVRDGKLDPRGFTVISLDEAAVLRGFGGTKTFREFMRLYEGSARYRFVATATPSPNDYIELLAYAAFLDIMDVGQAKTRFFKRDSTQADALTLRPHQEREFWLWVASWAMFLQKPSDLGHDDAGYELPVLDVRWHEVAARPTTAADTDRAGQGLLFRDTSLGVQEAAREKRESLDERITMMAALVAESPEDHFLLWHHLEAERRAITAAIPEAVAVWGSQDLDERERRIIDFSDGRYRILATKPVIAGSGCNFQRHCHRAVFVGIGFKFSEFIQAVHRIHRFLQDQPVRIDLIYTAAEREVRRILERKWAQHVELVATMGAIIQEYGLSRAAMAGALARSTGVERQEASGQGWRIVNNDAVLETAAMKTDSVDLVITSIPFSTQYEYTPSYNDFGHSESNDTFWQQMDFLTPHLYRTLRPGRVAAIHVKDRIAPGGLTNLGFQTVQPFHMEATFHYIRHGFAFLGMKTIVTDVVRENNQTYRLGWTEQCKDGSRMGVGMSEYVLLFRKPPTDASNGYADVPVVKVKPLTKGADGVVIPYDYDAGSAMPGTGYSRAVWQLDAHGFTRSSGDRLLTDEELRLLPHAEIYKRWRAESLTTVYDFARHVAVAEVMERDKRLPSTFMLLPPHSWHPDVWTNVARMRTLNMLQERKGLAMHLCPLQFDIVDRLITQFSMPGETVYDPFVGIGTVPYCAIKLKRVGWGTELSGSYFRDAVTYCTAAERQVDVPTMFEMRDVRGRRA